MRVGHRHGGWWAALVAAVGLVGTACSGPRCQGNPGDCADDQTCVDGTCTDNAGGSSGTSGNASSSGTPASSSGASSAGSAGSASGTVSSSGASGGTSAVSGGSSSGATSASGVTSGTPSGSGASGSGTTSGTSGAASSGSASGGTSGAGSSGGVSSSGVVVACPASGAAFSLAPTAFINANGNALAEAGGRGTVSVCLGQAPTEDVLVLFTVVDDNPRLTMDPAVLLFTPQNWTTPRTADVVAVDDLAVNANNGPFQVEVALSTADPAFSGLAARMVTVEVVNDDVRQVRLTPVVGTTMPEGGSVQVAVRLDAAPAGSKTVVVDLAPANTSAAAGLTVVPNQLTFNDSDFDDVQVVTVSAAQDELVEDDVVTQLRATINAATTDGLWSALGPRVLDAVTVEDDDEAGLTLTNATALSLLDRGSESVQFEVALSKQPQTNVVLGVTIPTAGALGMLSSSNTLTFTNGNWNVPQPVRVVGLVDPDSDPNSAFDVRVAHTSGDAMFAGVEEVVSIQSLESDVDNLLMSLSAGGATMNEGDTRTLSISTTATPGMPVTVTVTSSRPDVLLLRAQGDPMDLPSTSVMLTSGAQTLGITVVAVNDEVVRGLVLPMLSFQVTSADMEYAALMPPPIAFSVADTDQPAAVVTLPQAPLDVPEVGGMRTFQVRLAKAPVSNVALTFNLDAVALTQVTLPAAPLVFTPANWNTNQDVTVQSINDALDDGNRSFTVSLVVDDSNQDVPYATMPGVNITMRSSGDDDVAAIVVNRTSGLLVNEGGAKKDTFQVRLATQPDGGNVTCDVSASPSNVVTLNPATLVFNPNNWASNTTVTVTGVADTNPIGGSRAFTVATKCNYSTNTQYASGVSTEGVREGDYAVALSNGTTDGTFTREGADSLCGGTNKAVVSIAVHRIPNGRDWPLKRNAVYRSLFGSTWSTAFTVDNEGDIEVSGRVNTASGTFAAGAAFWTGFTLAGREGTPTLAGTTDCNDWATLMNGTTGTVGRAGATIVVVGGASDMNFGTDTLQCVSLARVLCAATEGGTP